MKAIDLTVCEFQLHRQYRPSTSTIVRCVMEFWAIALAPFMEICSLCIHVPLIVGSRFSHRLLPEME